MTAEMMPISDFELAQASAAGDDLAFESLYRAHVRKVYSLCLRILGNQADAEDLCQEVFVQLYRKIGTFQGASALSTWLYRLAVNKVFMFLRNERRTHREHSTEDNVLENRMNDAALSHRHEISIIDRITLEQAMAQLPTGYRSVLVLHDVEGFDHEEIGQVLGISSGTSKSQLHKARLRLRKVLLTTRRAKGNRRLL